MGKKSFLNIWLVGPFLYLPIFCYRKGDDEQMQRTTINGNEQDFFYIYMVVWTFIIIYLLFCYMKSEDEQTQSTTISGNEKEKMKKKKFHFFPFI